LSAGSWYLKNCGPISGFQIALETFKQKAAPSSDGAAHSATVSDSEPLLIRRRF
jgi:hypothetical protein